ncbi:MAG TPA: iron-siderophore ABC transporter substrate-binding protein [Acidimicrobiales bacterium]|nr:iron-siderophore ABC transporter substrate-binding protein [Acidimicrobiales bacterium]
MRRLASALVFVSCALAACGGDDEPTSGSASASAEPVVIQHAFGETEVPADVDRVVTWGWGSADAAIAVGVMPVAIPFDDYAGDDEGVLPWIREEIGDGDVPAVLPNTEDVPFEAIAAARPDVILAVYSGISQEEYELLSDIAPTVAYPEVAWSTPWRDTIEIVGTALGRSDEAAAVLDEIDATVAEEAEAHPELAGKTVAAVWDSAGTFYVYKPADARVAFLLDLGLASAPSVEALQTDESTFFFTLSYERLAELESDIVVSYADTEEQQQTFLGSEHGRLLPAVQWGAVASVVGTELIASVSPPTALSVTWGLDELVAALSEAVAAGG